MKLLKTSRFAIISVLLFGFQFINGQNFQGKAYYNSKTTMDMSRFRGRQMTEQQKKEMEVRMKPFLEKTFILTFNKEASMFKEEEKLASPNAGGRGFRFMSSLSSGPIFKNIKTRQFIQDQEFFGKQFLVKEPLTEYTWIMGKETKQIGKYTAFKATTEIVASDLNWSRPQPTRGRDNEDQREKSTDSTEVVEERVEIITITAWYTPMIPVSQGPGEFWGLPGLILELSTGDTVMLCSKIIMNPEEKESIKVPEKGKAVTRAEYSTIINEKMQEFRNSRRGGGRPNR